MTDSNDIFIHRTVFKTRPFGQADSEIENRPNAAPDAHREPLPLFPLNFALKNRRNFGKLTRKPFFGALNRNLAAGLRQNTQGLMRDALFTIRLRGKDIRDDLRGLRIGRQNFRLQQGLHQCRAQSVQKKASPP